MNKQKLMATLGLGAKARNLVFGTNLFTQIKAQKVYLVILGRDMGTSQKKKFLNRCQYYQVQVWPDVLTCQEISLSCGKTKRVAVGITNENLFLLIKSIIK